MVDWGTNRWDPEVKDGPKGGLKLKDMVEAHVWEREAESPDTGVWEETRVGEARPGAVRAQTHETREAKAKGRASTGWAPRWATVWPWSAAARILHVNSLTCWSLVSSSATSSGRPGPCASIYQNLPAVGGLLVRMLCSTPHRGPPSQAAMGSSAGLGSPGSKAKDAPLSSWDMPGCYQLVGGLAWGCCWPWRMALAVDLPQWLLCPPSCNCYRTRPRWWPRPQVSIAPPPLLVSFGSLLGVTPVQPAAWSPQAASLRAQPMQRPGSSHSGLSQASSCLLRRPGLRRLSREDKSEPALMQRHKSLGEAVAGPWDCFLSFGRLWWSPLGSHAVLSCGKPKAEAAVVTGGWNRADGACVPYFLQYYSS